MGINMKESTEEGKAFENASAEYVKDTSNHVRSNEWEKMAAMTRGEYIPELEEDDKGKKEKSGNGRDLENNQYT